MIPDWCDRITLAGMCFEACHGVFAHEKEKPQPFEVDVELYFDFAPAVASDDLNDTVDYGQVYEIVRRVMTGPPANLIEHLAGRIAEQLLALGDPLQAVVCRVRKPEAPLPGPFRTVEAAVCRRRNAT